MVSRKQKVVDLVSSLFDIEKKVVDLVIEAIPAEARKHAKTARKEQLLALRAMLDSRIKSLEEDEKKVRKGPTRVEVE